MIHESPIVPRSLGRQLVDTYGALETAECQDFCAAVTNWHRDRHLRAIP